MQEFPFDEIDELYRGVILEHYRRSRNRSRVPDPDIEYDEYNPVCGDRVVLQLKLDDGLIWEVGFHGEGCAISQASASMMTDSLKGKTLEEAWELSEAFRGIMDRDASANSGKNAGLGDLEALQAVRRFPVRIKCALLSWTALEEGIDSYRAKTRPQKRE